MSDAVLGAFSLPTPERVQEFGRALAEVLRAGDLLILHGDLGAGKTTLTQGIGMGLRAREAVTSPTFVLAQTHPTESGVPLIHVDAYRLHDALELDDLDLDVDHAITVVEWGRPFADALAEQWVDIELVRPLGGDDQDFDPAALDAPEPRAITVRAHGHPQLAYRMRSLLQVFGARSGDDENSRN